MRSTRWIVMAMGALLIALFVITASPPAHAADATPTPGATAGEVQTEPCTPTATVGCLAGTLPAGGAGVEVTATGPAGTFTAKTNKSGQWSIAVTQAGSYAVTLDKATLPDNVKLTDDSPRTRPVTLNATAAVLFSLSGNTPSGGGAAASTGFD
ncbi:MAG: hypothetical protein J0I70_14690, partial [Microbacterium sp.]|nr:hypothetical protein [Microbacterium sp.]